ncbi:hypothetical protein QVD17_24328 [Tagetes erecta]|uniref:Uncharacterized protein n=1 Tax=Tagetes erecta TaxID=13708 RepID=A0AAD8KEY2_TARER|nr:hypothetical protein QVD17_24328 [Tagetes erecta]
MDGGGCIYEGENVQKAFVTHYENFLGVKGDISLTPTPDLFQKRLDSGVANLMIRPMTDEEVRKAMFKEASIDEERFLKQKSKVEWLAEGDNNTVFFHNSLKSRNHRSRIDVIMDGGGCIYEGENVQKAFVTHYENFLGVKGDISLTPTPDLFQKRLDSGVANLMIRPMTDEEVRKAMFKEASIDEERFLKQKSKVEWLAEGDNNTVFFHNSLKSRNHRSRIDVIMDGGGCIYEGENVQKAFVTHYENFLGVKGDISLTPTPDLFQKRLDSGVANLMIRPMTDEEVRKAMFKEASIDEERFLKQKSKVEWLAEGDNNTVFFHNSLKSRNHRSRIDVIMDGGGCIYEGENVQKAFVTHYENFLGVKGDISLTPTPDLFQKRLDSGVANLMIRPMTDEELPLAQYFTCTYSILDISIPVSFHACYGDSYVDAV